MNFKIESSILENEFQSSQLLKIIRDYMKVNVNLSRLFSLDCEQLREGENL